MNNTHFDYLKDYLALADAYMKQVDNIEIPPFDYDGDPDGEDAAADEYYEMWGNDENPNQYANIASRIAGEIERGTLKELNERYLALGLDKSLLRDKLPMTKAIHNMGPWYSSSCW